MRPYDLSLIVAIVVSAIILLLAVAVVWQMFFGKMDLAYLLSEPVEKGGDDKPKASLSRFQFLVFTFVIAGLYLVLSIEAGTLIAVPEGALILLGISGGSYLISKATSAKADARPTGDEEDGEDEEDQTADAGKADATGVKADMAAVKADMAAIKTEVAAIMAAVKPPAG